MKQIITFIIILLLFKNSFGQIIPDQKPNILLNGKKQGDWVFWYNSKWEKTNLIDSAVFYRKITFKDDNPIGIVTDYYKSGKPQMQMTLLSIDPDIKDGKVILYLENGTKSFECYFVKGKEIGIAISYYESRKIYSKENYVDGLLEGKAEYFFESGSLATTGNFKKSERTDNWIWYFETGIKEKEYFYIGDKMNGNAVLYYPSGKVQMKEIFKDNLEHGYITSYYENGNLKSTGWFKNAKRSGRWIWYTENGEFEIEESYGLESQNAFYLDLIARADEFKARSNIVNEIQYLSKAVNYSRDSLGFYDNSYIYSLLKIASRLSSMNEYNEALPYNIEAFEVTQKWLGKNHKDYEVALNNLAQLYQNIGENKKALPLFLEELNLVEKFFGREYRFGVVSHNIAEIYYELTDYEKAIEYYILALNTLEHSVGKKDESYAITAEALATLYDQLDQTKKSLPLYLDLVYYSKNTLGQNNPEYGKWLRYLAVSYYKTGRYEEALPVFVTALNVTEKTLGKGHTQYGICLNNFASLYQKMGQFDKALPLFKEGLELIEKNIGKNTPNYAAGLNNLSGMYQEMGQYETSLKLCKEALAITEKVLGKDHPDYAIRILNLAGLYQAMDRNELALPFFLEGLKIIEKTSGKNSTTYGTALNNLAGLYKSLGQYDKAANYFKEAINITEKTLGKSHPEYAQSLNNLAMVYDAVGQYKDALPLYLEALNNLGNLLGKDHPNYGVCLNNIAELYRKTAQYDKALPYYQEALTNTEKSVGKDHISYTNYLSNLALMYSEMGNYEKALPIQLAVLENFDKIFGKENTHYRVCLNNLASLYQHQGNYEKANPIYTEALNYTFKDINRNFSFLSEKEKTDYVNTLLIDFEIYKNFYLKYSKQLPSVSSEIFNMELSIKGMILNSGVEMRRNLVNSGDTNAIKLIDEWNYVKDYLAKQYSLPASKRRVDIIDIEENANKIEAELVSISSTFKAAKSLLGTKWTDINNSLKPNEVAIEFTSFYYQNGMRWSDSFMYLALVLRKGDIYPSLIPLCEKRQLDSLFHKAGSTDANFIAGLYRGANVVNTNNSFSYGKRLYELIWKPLDKLLSKGDKVYFVPSGLLNQIAFSALPYSKDSLLSDRYNLQQLSSTAMLLRESAFSSATPKSMTIFGGIKYDASEKEIAETVKKIKSDDEFISRSLPADLNRGETMDYLLGTLIESKAIAEISEKNKIKVNAYYGLDALEETYKKMGTGKSPNVLHISTHGFFFPDPKKDNRDNLNDDQKQVFKYSDNPLLRSGLLLAGANNAWGGKALPDIEDGILTAYEAANVSLANTQLVVLSACETGLGDIIGSEGVFGLQRAFKMAGAEYLMMSLWKVPDTETAEFMTHFYSTWFSGQKIPDAFTDTQNYMKTKYPNDPYKWAAFVLVK